MDNVFLSAMQQTIVLLPLCLGMYLTYCIMNITDLTVEGTFVLGAGLYARMIVAGHSVYLAVSMALAAAMLVGFIVAVMQRAAKLDALITGILAVFMLYSVNFKVMGRPNISLLGHDNMMQSIINMSLAHMLITITALACAMLGVIYFLLKSKYGLLLRTYGQNKSLLLQLAQPQFIILCAGLMLGNLMAAGGGVLTAQLNGYADIKMGLGVALTGIGSIMLGVNMLRFFRSANAPFHACYELIAALAGVFVYFLGMNVLLYFNVDPMYIKLLLGIMLMFFLSSHRLLSKRGRYVHA